MSGSRASAVSRHPAGSHPARGKALRRLADGLCLAAAPAFVLMALVSLPSRGMSAMACAAMPDTAPFGGMATMYFLMGVFNLTPWLRLASARTAPDREGRAGDM
jgi:hypothetical protein